MLQYAASDLGLHYLLRPVCPNTVLRIFMVGRLEAIVWILKCKAVCVGRSNNGYIAPDKWSNQMIIYLLFLGTH